MGQGNKPGPSGQDTPIFDCYAAGGRAWCYWCYLQPKARVDYFTLINGEPGTFSLSLNSGRCCCAGPREPGARHDGSQVTIELAVSYSCPGSQPASAHELPLQELLLQFVRQKRFRCPLVAVTANWVGSHRHFSSMGGWYKCLEVEYDAWL